MSVYRRGKVWYYHFEIEGNRFRGSTRVTEKAAAERIAANVRLRAIEDLHFPRGKEVGLYEALFRYYSEHASHLPSAYTIHGYVRRLQSLGDVALMAITDATVAEYIARRRSDQVRGKRKTRKLISNTTVNHEVRCLRAVLKRAELAGAAVPKIKWAEHLLAEPKGRTVYLSTEQETALIDALRPDFRPLVRFCLLSGARLTSAIRLTWSDVDYAAKHVIFRKVKGGGSHTIPLTRDMTLLLANERGTHPVYVFTYEAAEDRPGGTKGAKRKRGERYPFSKDGWRRAWARACKKAGLPGFRFHDLRHTAGSRLTKGAGLAFTQQLLGHADIKTTLRYSHVLTDDLHSAMERLANNHTDSPKPSESQGRKRKS